MGKITDALKKAADERMNRLDKISNIEQKKLLIVKKIGDSDIDPRIVTYYDPKALITEQYKTLRTNIMASNKKTPPKVIVVTSAVHSEGKSITTLNLAMSIAQMTHKHKVLLIDGDMRRGRVHKYLGTEWKEGLSEYLEGGATLEDVIFKLDIDNLSIIPCGQVPDQPAELLESSAMANFLKDMRKEFDFIIIDSPPIISVTDSGIIGSQADGVLMVIQAGRTQRGIVTRAMELLHQCHARVIGHVLTNIEYHLPEYIYRYL